MDLKALESCIERYESLQKLENETPQTRGQKFNQLIADILQAHEIQAVANQRQKTKGEIDVSFRAAEMRFILEAKWEQTPIDIGPFAKLKLRLNQRMPNSYGILLSVSGFTQSVIDQTHGRGLENVFLMGPDIFKALLFGSIEAENLFGTFIDYASFEGEYNPSLQKVFQYLPKRSNRKIDPDEFCNSPSSTLKESLRPEGQFKEYEVILSNLPTAQCGISIADSEIYVTLDDGIYKLKKAELTKTIDVDLPQNRAVFSEIQNAVLFVYKGSVIAVNENGEFNALTKRYPGHVRVFRSNKNIHLFSNGSFLISPFSPPRILKNIDGKQSEISCDEEAGYGVDAVMVNQDEYIIAGNRGLTFYRENQALWHLESRCSAVSIYGNRVFFNENSKLLKSVDFQGKDMQKIASFRLGGSIRDFAVLGRDEYIFYLSYQQDEESKGSIVRVKTK